MHPTTVHSAASVAEIRIIKQEPTVAGPASKQTQKISNPDPVFRVVAVAELNKITASKDSGQRSFPLNFRGRRGQKQNKGRLEFFCLINRDTVARRRTKTFNPLIPDSPEVPSGGSGARKVPGRRRQTGGRRFGFARRTVRSGQR